MLFLLKNMVGSFMDIGLVLLIVSCMCDITDLQDRNPLWADMPLSQAASLLALHFFMAVFPVSQRSSLVRPTIMMSGLNLSQSSGALISSHLFSSILLRLEMVIF